jgi:hypothetical protein
MRRTSIRSLVAGIALATVTALVPATAVAAGTTTPDPIASACGETIPPSEIAGIVALSDLSTITETDPVRRFDAEMARNHTIVTFLTRHHDWRGLFMVGLDYAESHGMSTLQHNATGFTNPAFGHAFTPELLSRFLVNVHAEFSGQPEDPQWAQYFGLAHQCGVSPVQVALAGYNAHLGVDVGASLAAVHVQLSDLPDYLTVNATVIGQSQGIVDATRSAYGVDLAPAWPSLIAAGPSLLAAAFVNVGLGRNDPALVASVQSQIENNWSTLNTTVH